jgi:hypothetical protein
MAMVAGRYYIPKRYPVARTREPVVAVLEQAVVASGARVISCSFRRDRVAPVYLGAEDEDGRRYGMVVYPFTTTRRVTKNRPGGEHRAQIRLGDPVRSRDERNLIARDPSGVDVTLVLAVDPVRRHIVGLDPLVYEDLPMGISVYYRDEHAEAIAADGWAVWEREKSGGQRRDSWEGLETLVGFRPERLLDFVRFEARSSALGLDPGLRSSLAQGFRQERGRHDLETMFDLDAATILDIVETNFRLGVAVRGGVAEHHLEAALRADPAVRAVRAIDADGQPDFAVGLHGGREILVECKTASQKRYQDGDFKVEAQKTRDSGAGRKYTFDQFDVLAACLFSATGRWEFRFRSTVDLTAWPADPTRIAAIQRIDRSWASSLGELVH